MEQEGDEDQNKTGDWRAEASKYWLLDRYIIHTPVLNFPWVVYLSRIELPCENVSLYAFRSLTRTEGAIKVCLDRIGGFELFNIQYIQEFLSAPCWEVHEGGGERLLGTFYRPARRPFSFPNVYRVLEDAEGTPVASLLYIDSRAGCLGVAIPLAPAGIILVSAGDEEICRVQPLPGWNLDNEIVVTGNRALLPDPRLVLACSLIQQLAPQVPY
jgi:hypothetical protein